jgi:RHS repeat-associated protein
MLSAGVVWVALFFGERAPLAQDCIGQECTGDCGCSFCPCPSDCGCLTCPCPPGTSGGGNPASEQGAGIANNFANNAFSSQLQSIAASQAARTILTTTPSNPSQSATTIAKNQQVTGAPTRPAPVSAVPSAQGQQRAPHAVHADGPSTDPIDPFNGEFHLEHVDLSFPGFGVPFELKRTYRSRVDLHGPMGFGWDHSLNQRISASGKTFVVAMGDATSIVLGTQTKSGTDTVFKAPPGVHLSFVRHSDRTWTVTSPSGITRTFDSAGQLTKVVDGNSNGLGLTWETVGGGPSRVKTVQDSVGRTISFNYCGPMSLLCTVTDAQSGLSVTYHQDGEELSSATDAEGVTESYHYTRISGDPPRNFLPETVLRVVCDQVCSDDNAQCIDDSVKTCATECKQACDTSCTLCRDCGGHCRDPKVSGCNATHLAGFFSFDCQDELTKSMACEHCQATDPINPQESIGICRAACLQNAVPECEQTLGQRAVGPCLSACGSMCKQACDTATPCASTCPTKCEEPCTPAALGPACLSGCLAGCRQVNGSSDPKPVYGLQADLAFNLEDVFDGSGALILHNDYGTDPHDPSFDAVNTQRTGDGFQVGATYVDLESAANAAERQAFESVVICPRIRSQAGALPVFGDALRGAGQLPFGPDAGKRVQPPPLFPTFFDGLWGVIHDPFLDRYIPAKPSFKTQLTDAYGVVWTFYYDRDGHLMRSVNDGTGAVRSYNYDDDGNLQSTEDPLLGRVCVTHDRDGNVLQSVDKPASVGFDPGYHEVERRFTYQKLANGAVRLATVADPNDLTKVVESMTWDDFGNPKDDVLHPDDATTLPTSYVYTNGRLTQLTAPDGAVTKVDYESGAVSSVVRDVGGANLTTTLHRDAAGRPQHGISELGEKTDWVWTGGQLQTMTRTDDDKSVVETYGYDANGRIQTITDDLRKITQVYDHVGNLRRIKRESLVDAAVSVNCALSGPDGRLLEEVLPGGERRAYFYDGEGRSTGYDKGTVSLFPTPEGWDDQCDRSDHLLSNQEASRSSYDLSGHLLSQEDDRGAATSMGYDLFGRVVSVTNPNGATARLGLDRCARAHWAATFERGHAPEALVKPADAHAAGLLAMTEVVPDRVGRPTQTTDWHFDDQGNFIGRDGHATRTFDYLTAQRRVSVHGDNGFVVDRDVDGAGRVTLVHVSGGVVVTEYDRSNPRVSIQRMQGPAGLTIATKVTTTAWGAPAVENHLRENTLLAFVNGKPKFSDPGSFLDQVAARLRRLLDIGNSSLDATNPIVLEKWDYDNHQRLVLDTAASKGTRAPRYDGLDRVVGLDVRHDLDGPGTHESVTLALDAAGRIHTRTSDIGDALPATTTYDRDGLGMIRTVTWPDGSTRTMSYASVVQPLVAILKDERGTTFNFEYDGRGDLHRASLPAPITSQTFCHLFCCSPRPLGSPPPNCDCRIERFTHPCSAPPPPVEAETRVFERDGLGRLITATRIVGEATDSHSNEVTFRWDSLGGKISEVHSFAPSDPVLHTFNDSGRPISSKIGGLDVTRDFMGDGRLRTLAIPGTFGADPIVTFAHRGLGPAETRQTSGEDARMIYDELGRLSGIEDMGGTLASLAWASPVDGVPRTFSRSFSGAAPRTSVYDVDRSGRLLRELDDVPKMAVPGIAATASFEVASAAIDPLIGGGLGYQYDARGNWLERTSPSVDLTAVPNQSDRYTVFAGLTPGYDRRGYLSTLGDESYDFNDFGELKSATVNGVQTVYVTDALGRVARETTGDVSVTYGYDGDRRVVRRRGDGSDVTIDGDGIDEHLLTIDTSGKRAPFFYHQDRQGSVYMISDGAGKALETYDYSAYGERTIRGQSGQVIPDTAFGVEFGFQGHPQDERTKLVSIRARAYRPAWGRFLSPDPVGYGGGSNVYAFVQSAPLGWVDPYGLHAVLPSGPGQAAAPYTGPYIGADPKEYTGIGGVLTSLNQLYWGATQGTGSADAIIPGLILNTFEGVNEAYDQGGAPAVVRTLGRAAVPFDLIGTGAAQVFGAQNSYEATSGLIKVGAGLVQFRAVAALARPVVPFTPSGIPAEVGIARVAEIRADIGVPKGKNIAYAEVNLGGDTQEVVGISGGKLRGNTAPPPISRQFQPIEVGGYVRDLDAEVKILEDLARVLPQNSSGVVRLFSQFPVCESCTGVVEQFRAAFPDIQVIVTSGPGR